MEDKGFDLLEWRCDAKHVVDQVLNKGELMTWWYRKEPVEINSRFMWLQWPLAWIPKEANKWVDAVATYALKCNKDLIFERKTLIDIPYSLAISLRDDHEFKG